MWWRLLPVAAFFLACVLLALAADWHYLTP